MEDGKLSGCNVAILVSNGFSEKDLTNIQRALIAHGARAKLVSLDSGLVNGWSDNRWGHHFAVDCPLNSALAADFSMLVLPGGRRSIDKLKLTAHTRRFIGGFMLASKPVAVFGRALQLMTFADRVRGFTVSGPADVKDETVSHGAIWSDELYSIDRNVITGDAPSCRDEFIDRVIEHFAAYSPALPRAAA